MEELRKKILVVFGTRPEAIKMAPLTLALLNIPEIECRICVTAQHREMLDQVLQLFNITPDYDLNLMKRNQDLFDITSRILVGLKSILSDFLPDLVFVHGDTSTSFSAALAAFYNQIPIGHIEAGLRTHNMYSPWPEEINRQLTARLTTYHFAPTALNMKNLIKEGIKEENIVVTGNTVIDALYSVTEMLSNNESLQNRCIQDLIDAGYSPADGRLSRQTYSKNRVILVTGHRRENIGDGFIEICKGLSKIAENNPTVDIVYPVHLNPKVRTPVSNMLSGYNNIYLTDPLDYLPFVYLMSKSYIILTDSGGIQEEAPALGIPVIVLRENTERPEALEANTAKLVGTDSTAIHSEVQMLLDSIKKYEKVSSRINPYGDGKATERIVSFIKDEIF